MAAAQHRQFDRAEQILERARVHAEQQKDVIVRQINAQLEEKGIQLIAAKYKIEQYAKEIENAQIGLGSLNSRIREMADDLGDEIAERMSKIFANMPLATEA